jgi:two-component system nitrate/nitrite response regulator NarL
MYLDLCLISPSDISREGLSNILSQDGFSIVGSFRDAAEFDTEGLDQNVLVVVDHPSSEDQQDCISTVLERLPRAIVVVLAENFDLQEMMNCFDAGAQGYIIKSLKSGPLTAALKLAAIGEKVLPSALVDALDLKSSALRSPYEVATEVAKANLSPREHDVLCCLMAGYSNKVIARELMVCEATVKVHVKAILRKLKVSNRTQAAIWASSRGYSDEHTPF